MAQVNDGGTAFPTIEFFDEKPYASQPGMSLRDYFAIHAPEPNDAAIDAQAQRDKIGNPHNDSYKPKRRGLFEIRADLRYMYADAMIEARKK